MRTNAVIVADDNPARARDLVRWLRACGIPAYATCMDFPAKPIMRAICELQPSIVLCRPDSTGMALFQPLRQMSEPPMVILLRESDAAGDELRQEDGLIVASIRTPVPMTSLCGFVRTALTTIARLDARQTAKGDGVSARPRAERFGNPGPRAWRDDQRSLAAAE